MEYIIGELGALVSPFMTQFRTLFPYWIAGLALSAFLTAYGENAIEKAAGKLRDGRLNIMSIAIACLLGIASPLCMYGTVPLIAILSRKGISQGILTGFMVCSILLNPTLMVMTLALGVRVFLLRLILVFAAGMLAGVLVSYLYKTRSVFNTAAFDKECTESGRTKFRQFLHSLRRNFEITAPYFLVGITLTVLFQRYLPTEIFTAVLGEKNPFAILVSASIGVPLYMCGGGTIPLIKAWLDSGMSMGAAVAFMISGPATKLNNLSAVKAILGKTNFLIYLVYCLAFSTIAGYVTDFLF
jgi:uncharacterized membrane protein YraQ (UPF0718 family)